jgi:hypothetical protein
VAGVLEPSGQVSTAPAYRPVVISWERTESEHCETEVEAFENRFLINTYTL